LVGRERARLGAAGLAAAFLVGLCDDVLARGLAPAGKLAGQTLAGCALAAAGLRRRDARAVAAALCIVALAVIAQNAINTFDNADGAASGARGARAARAGADRGRAAVRLPGVERAARA
jgi:hypothetical protein